MTDIKDISAHFSGLHIIHQKIKGRVLGDHQHSEHEFFFPLQGEIQIQVNQKRLKAGAGKIIYIPPNTVHSFKSDSASQGERLILIADASLWKKHDGSTTKAIVISASQLCKEILFQLLIYPKTKAAPALIQTLVQTLSEMLEASNEAQIGNPSHLTGKSEDKRIQQALETIKEQYSENISMNILAKNSGLSLRNLNRLFLIEIGISPKQVIIFYRIDQAKKLLRSGKKSVTDTALEVGYSSVSQFISTFRKHTGQVPSSFLPLNKK